MLFSATVPPETSGQSGLRWWENERFAIGWRGHLYLPGEVAGVPSVAKLADSLTTVDLTRVTCHLGGVFGLFVRDKSRGGWQIATDNAGLYKVFYDAKGASTSLLELVRARGSGRDALDLAVIVEFLAQGQVLGTRSFVSGVDRLSGREILVLPADASPPFTRTKALPDVMPGDTSTVLERFAHLARSLQGRSFSVDATGGFDTRLVICLLAREGVPFELATSGRPGAPDSEIARQMARTLDRPFRLTGHDLSDLDDQLVATFRDGDGQTDLRRFHRDRQNALARLARGVEVFAHGGGGEIYRDHCFIQDFPNYGSRKINLQRYFRLRMMPVSLPADILTRAGRELLAAAQASVLDRFRALAAATNNETYDRIYFLLRSPEHFGQHCANYVNMGLDAVAPLLDYQSALAAIGLPPWSRFFYRWHRGMISARCPDLASLPTADGFSASDTTAAVLRDARSYLATQLRRVGRKLSQRVTGKSRFHNVGAFAADAPDFNRRLRASPHFATGLARLKDVGILGPHATGSDLRDIHVGRVLTLGMFLGEVGGQDRASTSA
jgi:hypothetical protein